MFAGEAVSELWPPPPPSALPAGLDEMAPGPELGALLAGIDLDSLPGFDLVVVMRAHARQVSFQQAELLAAVARVADASNEASGLVADDDCEVADDEIRAALSLTRRAATLLLDLALELRRLPQLWEALRSGVIDLPRARVVCHEVATLDDREAQEVVTQVLEGAGTQTTGQLGARVRRLVLSIDPTSAKERYERGVEGRRVELSANPDGTANLIAYSLPAERANAAYDRLDHLGVAAKGPDDPRSLDQVRADVLLDLVDNDPGSTHRGVVDLKVDLATLTEMSDNPGEIPGYGPVIADVARQVAATQQGSQWRVTVTDPDSGAVLWNGTTKRRPTPAQRRYVEARSPTCVFPGCRMPATRSDLDHRVDHSKGGPTLVKYLNPLCRPPPAQRHRMATATRTRRHHHLDQPPRTHLHHRTRPTLNAG
jgi:Domain of unknown function (DUF222)